MIIYLLFRNIKGTSVDILNKKILDVVSLKKYIALNEVYFWQCTPSLLGYTLHFRTTYSCVHRTIWLHKLYSFIYYHGMWLSPVLDGLNVYTCCMLENSTCQLFMIWRIHAAKRRSERWALLASWHEPAEQWLLLYIHVASWHEPAEQWLLLYM